MEQPANSEKLAATTVAPGVESCRPQPTTEVVTSVPTATTGSTADVVSSPVRPVIEVVFSLPTASNSSTVSAESRPVQAIIEVVPSVPAASTSSSIDAESSPVPPVIEVIPSLPAASTSSTVGIESSPVQPVNEVVPSLPEASTGSTVHAESDPVQPIIQVIPSAPTTSSNSTVHGHTARSALRESNNHFRLLHAGFDCLHHIFQYLDVCTRLRAALVCRCWHLVALQQHLWSVVRLRGLRVTDWSRAVRHFTHVSTQLLDLRGVQQDAESWHELTRALHHLVTVTSLRIGSCPASVVHAIADQMFWLQQFSAENIADPDRSTCSELNLSRFSHFRCLEKLQLRANNGLTLADDGFTNSANVGGLVRLKTLSLTSLRNVPGHSLNFVGCLLSLRTLEIGDCFQWTSETFEMLGNLTSLMTLRLESW